MDHTKNAIISSVFSRRNALGVLEETYVSHIKVWEDSEGSKKPRYLLISQASNGTGYIHKAKLNTNGSFSVGKSWRLAELRVVQATGQLSFSLVLSRSYKWTTENANDQEAFLHAIIDLFKTVTSDAPLQVLGFEHSNSQPGRQRIQSDYMKTSGRVSPAVAPSRMGPNRGASQSGQSDPDTDPGRASAHRHPSRPPSPSHSVHSYASGRTRDVPRAGTASPAPSQSAVRPPASRRPSNIGPGSVNPPVPPTPSIRSARSPYPTNDASSSSRPPAPEFPPQSKEPPPRSESNSPTIAPVRTRKQTTRGTTGAQASDVNARRDANTRISFFDPVNQNNIERLTGDIQEVDGDDETARVTLENVEEMIEGYEWASDDVINRERSHGAAALIEARLLDELMALEKANIHSFLESDDRITVVLKYLDDAVAELDNMGSMISSYKIHLNAVGDDISYIQSQNRGLQVQTQNQRALLAEVENLMQTVQVDKDVLLILTQGSLEKASSIQNIEEAASELYKALQAGRDTDMAATMERLNEYRTHNVQFCKRIFDFLSIMFTAQSKLLLGDNSGIATSSRGRPAIIPHKGFESYLGRYSGLILYLKEMDESVYGKLCATYFSASSELHGTQIKALMSTYINFVKKAPEETQEQSLGTASAPAAGKSGIRRAGTLIRSPMDRNREKERGDGDLLAPDVLSMVLEQIAPLLAHEDEFMADFLQINDIALTFADYMGLDSYFKRQASRTLGLSQATMKLVRGAMDLIFGFLPLELKNWLDKALARDNTQIFGILACLERFIADSTELSGSFLTTQLEKQHTRLRGVFDRHINEQIQAVEQTKLTTKKRRGVIPFVKQIPVYIARVERQLVGAQGLEIRSSVDAAFDKIVQTMFDSLKQMAKMDGEGEDKGQLNYHVILIENMHHFVAEISMMEIGSVVSFLSKAESIYEENLNAYVKIVLRRPFAKIIDYFEGVERLLKTTAPTEIPTNSNYNRSALKKVVKEYNTKDIRKHVDTLFKRVEKHFTEASEKATTEELGGIVPGTVMVGVWRACQEEVLRMTELFSKRIAQCYGESGITLDYTPSDVESAFTRHQIVS